MDSRLKTILVSPLEWGLGHTVRLVPVIDNLLKQGHSVILASDGRSLSFLRFRFPGLSWVRMPFYPVRYPEKKNFFLKIIPQIPGILRAIRRNRKQVSALVREWSIDLIISDHRYGLTCSGVPSIFITNQLWLKAPKGLTWGEPLAYRLHLWYLRKFTRIWLPDFPGEPNISGIQTHPSRLPGRVEYIGPVSRFKGVSPEKPGQAKPFEILGLLSGPEPQRTILENILVHTLNEAGTRSIILRGLPPEDPSARPSEEDKGCVRLISHASDPHLLWYIQQAGRIVCRPGNSTVSDLIILGKTALLVPTPGQTEQEYVATHLAAQGWFEVCTQEGIRAYGLEFTPRKRGAYGKAEGRRQKAKIS
ncbi:MAG: glycosyltransferase [Bacteroidota bacterium]